METVEVKYAKLSSERMEARRIREMERKRLHRATKKANGICENWACSEPIAELSKSQCVRHRRENTLRRHAALGRKAFYLGAGSSPDRSQTILEHFRIENPSFSPDSEARSWMKENVELFADYNDPVLMRALQLFTNSRDVSDGGSDKNGFETPEWMEKHLWAAWLERNGGLSLEDYVIQKVDLEREKKAAYV